MEELSFLCKLKPNVRFFIQQSLSIAFCVLNTVLSLYYARIKKGIAEHISLYLLGTSRLR